MYIVWYMSPVGAPYFERECDSIEECLYYISLDCSVGGKPTGSYYVGYVDVDNSFAVDLVGEGKKIEAVLRNG